jgi:hypothetical protein
VPETSSGCAVIARTIRFAAAARGAGNAAGAASFASARANPVSGSAKFGAAQPSTPQGNSPPMPDNSPSAFATARCTGMIVFFIARRRDVPMPRDGEETRVLARAIVVDARRRFAALHHRFPHRLVAHRMRAAGEIVLAVQPMRSSHAATRVVCIGSPECEAQASATSSSLNPNASAAPDSRSGSAWIGFSDERGIDGRLDIAQRKHDRAIRVGNGDRAAMDALHEVAAGDFDKNGVGQASRLRGLRRDGSLIAQSRGAMRGYFAVGVDGISKPMNLGNLLRISHAFGASFFFTIDGKVRLSDAQSDTSQRRGPSADLRFRHGGGFPPAQGCRIVGVEITDDAVDLPRFRHPLRAAYVFGSERMSLSPATLARCEFVVKIPTKFSINVGMAGAIVMYDRLVSLGGYPARPIRPAAAPTKFRRRTAGARRRCGHGRNSRILSQSGPVCIVRALL